MDGLLKVNSLETYSGDVATQPTHGLTTFVMNCGGSYTEAAAAHGHTNVALAPNKFLPSCSTSAAAPQNTLFKTNHRKEVIPEGSVVQELTGHQTNPSDRHTMSAVCVCVYPVSIGHEETFRHPWASSRIVVHQVSVSSLRESEKTDI